MKRRLNFGAAFFCYRLVGCSEEDKLRKTQTGVVRLQFVGALIYI
jgi:hypothetical protein